MCVQTPSPPEDRCHAVVMYALVRTFRAPQMCTITLMYFSTPKSPSSFLLLSSLAPIKLDPFFTWEDHLIFLLSLHVENWTSTESPLSSLFSYAVSPPSLLAAISETKLKQQPLAGIPVSSDSHIHRSRQNKMFWNMVKYNFPFIIKVLLGHLDLCIFLSGSRTSSE